MLQKTLSRVRKRIRKFQENNAKVAYVHIPKTGGTYLAQLESSDNPVIWPVKYYGHCTIEDATKSSQSYHPLLGYAENLTVQRDALRRYLVMSTVRNPFSWLVSYAGHAGGWNPKYRSVEHYDYENVQKGFDYLIQTIADREDATWPNRKFIHFPIFSNAGELVIDWLNRTETLDNDLEALAEHLSMTYRRQPAQRVGGNRDYRTYYNDALIDLVYSTWGRELRLFGYEFDGGNTSTARLQRKIDPESRQHVTYDWFTDTLKVDGVEEKR